MQNTIDDVFNDRMSQKLAVRKTTNMFNKRIHAANCNASNDDYNETRTASNDTLSTTTDAGKNDTGMTKVNKGFVYDLNSATEINSQVCHSSKESDDVVGQTPELLNGARNIQIQNEHAFLEKL